MISHPGNPTGYALMVLLLLLVWEFPDAGEAALIGLSLTAMAGYRHPPA